MSGCKPIGMTYKSHNCLLMCTVPFAWVSVYVFCRGQIHVLLKYHVLPSHVAFMNTNTYVWTHLHVNICKANRTVIIAAVVYILYFLHDNTYHIEEQIVSVRNSTLIARYRLVPGKNSSVIYLSRIASITVEIK